MKRIFLLLFSVGTFLQAQEYAYDAILWQKSIGGEHAEYLYHALATPDYGFLLLGSSVSNATGQKNKDNQGKLDYFVWKIDEAGKQEWQQSFGGDENDFLTAGALTQDGGYILGGYSESSESGDKTTKSFGLADYWILKLDAAGNIQWQKTIGGFGNDELISIMQTQDRGYLLAGNSDSPKSDLKSENCFGAKDYWIIKLNPKGEIEWDKTLGGENTEELKSIIETKDSFILFGQTNSVDENNQFKDFDLEIIQLNKQGQIQKTLRYGSEAEDLFSSVYFDDEKQEIHLAGLFTNEDKRELKIIQLDENLKQLAESTKELDQNQIINSLLLTKNKEYLLAGSKLGYSGNSKSIQKPISSYQTMLLDQNGEDKWNKELRSDGFDYLQTALETRDGSIILIGNSDSNTSKDKKVSSQGQQDFWIVKLGNKKAHEETERAYIEAYPNPTRDFVNVLINQEFESASGKVLNLNGQLMHKFNIQYRTTPVNLSSYPPGIYIIQLQIDNQIESINILKK